jgi:hypothetical protein
MKIYDAQKNNENLLFAVATSIIVGNGDNISFWHIAWFQGLRPCDFTPSVHKLSRKKNRSLKGAIESKMHHGSSNFWRLPIYVLKL